MLVAEPTHEPDVEVGVTAYTKLPSVELLGLVSVWVIVEPLLALPPVMEPVLVPNVQVKVLATFAVRLTFMATPLQLACVVKVDTLGLGFTVLVILVAEPTHEPTVDVGVTA